MLYNMQGNLCDVQQMARKVSQLFLSLGFRTALLSHFLLSPESGNGLAAPWGRKRVRRNFKTETTTSKWSLAFKNSETLYCTLVVYIILYNN